MPETRGSPSTASSAARHRNGKGLAICSFAGPSPRQKPAEGVAPAPHAATVLAMSENLEVIKVGFDAFNRDGVDGILPYIHPEFESTTPVNLAAEPDTYRGQDGARRYFDSFNEVMEDIRWDAHSFQDVGDRVVVEFTLRAKGKSTGLDFGQDAVQVWEFRDGKAVSLELYPTLDEALVAAEGES